MLQLIFVASQTANPFWNMTFDYRALMSFDHFKNNNTLSRKWLVSSLHVIFYFGKVLLFASS